MPKAAKIHGRVHYDRHTRILSGQPEEPSRKARLYRVDRITDHPAVPGPVFSLTVLNDDGSVFNGNGYGGNIGAPWVYTVANTEHGLTCTCGDFEFRRAHEEFGCKHVEYILAVNLMRRK